MDQRSEDLKSYGIELDVRSKAAKEVLKRVKEAQDELESRSDTLDSMGSRLAEYDGVLARLSDMTGRVDDNLKLDTRGEPFRGPAGPQAQGLRGSPGPGRRGGPGPPGALRRGRPQGPGNRPGRDRRGSPEPPGRHGGGGRGPSGGDGAAPGAGGRLLPGGQRAGQGPVRGDGETPGLRLPEGPGRGRAPGVTRPTKIPASRSMPGDRLKEALDTKLKTLQEAAKERVLETQGLVKGFKAEWQKEARELADASRSEIAGQTELIGRPDRRARTRAG
ncbi:MAG: hypothetical protein MZV70_22325 [Desulfobacterales bacterium]|nr:hypothetical protein [Desulfobacterales bacterium]